jgi:hypothetical protein
MGEVLRHHIEDLIAKYVTRLRSDPLAPGAKSLPNPLLEDHALSFLSDLFQSVVVVEKADDLDDREESNLLGDGTRIQLLIADLHGRQRHRLGWTERALHREYEILDEEVARMVKGRVADPDTGDAPEPTIELLRRFLGRAHEASFAGFKAAALESRR